MSFSACNAVKVWSVRRNGTDTSSPVVIGCSINRHVRIATV